MLLSVLRFIFGNHNADSGDLEQEQEQECRLKGCLVIAPRMSGSVGLSIFLVRTQETAVMTGSLPRCASPHTRTHIHTQAVRHYSVNQITAGSNLWTRVTDSNVRSLSQCSAHSLVRPVRRGSEQDESKWFSWCFRRIYYASQTVSAKGYIIFRKLLSRLN